MKKLMKWILLILAVLLIGGIAIYVVGIRNGGGIGGEPDNMPYVPDKPEPPAHSGMFVSDLGTMEFNGDGKTIVIDFQEELAELCGLPAGRSEGTYVFLSGDLPPHGSMEIRYDAAHEMRITVGDVSAVMDMGTAAEDGKTGHSGIDTVTETKIPMLFLKDGKFIDVVFEKEEN